MGTCPSLSKHHLLLSHLCWHEADILGVGAHRACVKPGGRGVGGGVGGWD